MTEEEAYAQVALEVRDRDIKPGLHAKALADSLGNESLAKSLYLKFRAQQIILEHLSAEKQLQAARHIAERQRLSDSRKANSQRRRHKFVQCLCITFAALFGCATFIILMALYVSIFVDKKGGESVALLVVFGLCFFGTFGCIRASKEK